jgi:glycine hydroxymethyltransferase
MLKKIDPQIATELSKELYRQEEELNLIASENYASEAVLEATASILTNKYAEGYPGKRYYGGCQIADNVENLAIERCKKIFGAEHVNVQAHSGSQANMAAYFAVLNPGDSIMGMSLSEGGHLTHGHPVNFSGKLFNIIKYGVNKEAETLDYKEIEKLAKEHKPKLIVVGASAYSRTIDFEKFGKIAKSINALLMADIAHIAGLIATGLHPNPFPHADIVTSTTHKTLRGPRGGLIMCKKELAEKIDKSVMPGIQGGPFMHIIAAKAVAFKLALEPEFKEYQEQVIKNAKSMSEELKKLGYKIISGGTDNHLFLVDVKQKELTGVEAESALAKVGIYVNRNTIPFDSEKPWITSGIRIGTPAITTRGLKEDDAILIAHWIDEALKNKNDETKLSKIKSEVRALCLKHKIYSSNYNLSDVAQRQFDSNQ